MNTDSTHPVHTALLRNPSFKDSAMHTVSLTYSDLSASTLRAFAPVYAAAATAHPFLCELPTLADMLAYLAAPALPGMPARPTVLRVLVTLAQTEPHPVWSSLLVIAYRPFIHGLVSAGKGDRADREGLVVACFLEAVAAARIKVSSISLEIRARTEKLLAALALADREWSEVALAGDGHAFVAPEAVPRIDLARRPGRTVRDGVSDQDLLRTLGERGALVDLVGALHDGATERAQRNVYAVLVRRRARLARNARRRRLAA